MRAPRLALCGAVFAAVASTVAMSSADSPTTTAGAQLDAVLTSIESSACLLTCEYLSCTEPEHITYQHENSNDGGEEHSCAWSTGGCTDHNCGIGMNEQPSSLNALASRLDSRTIKRLQQRHPNFRIVAGRDAVQILGCNGEVLMSQHLGPTQIQDVATRLR